MFPKDFMWGASTSAHQVEGDTHNQWSEWEKANATRLAAAAKSPKQAMQPENYISGNGVNHYELYKQDFQLLRALNMNSYRFSIEWSRLQPEMGKWDESAIQHYHDYIDELLRLSITPILTIWHWTMPVWFTEQGGFEKAANIAHFETFVARIATEYASKVTYIITLNEPNTYVQLSYITGAWPPQRKQPLLAIKTYRNLVVAHKRAYTILKRVNADLKIGVAMTLASTHSSSRFKLISTPGIILKDYIANWWFLDRIKGFQDYIGTNFYFSEYYNWYMRLSNPPTPKSDYGWYMEPAALQDVLQATHKRYGLPQIVTENGLADADDQYRAWWLNETLEAMQKALDNGVVLQGYMHWSLLDNFEWADGWWPKFGLIAVDRSTMQRSIRPSATWFAKRIDMFRNSL